LSDGKPSPAICRLPGDTWLNLLAADGRPFLTLDDQTTRDTARTDPVGFVRGLDRTIIDEVQRAPQVLLAIKRAVDTAAAPVEFKQRRSTTHPENVESLGEKADKRIPVVLLPAGNQVFSLSLRKRRVIKDESGRPALVDQCKPGNRVGASGPTQCAPSLHDELIGDKLNLPPDDVSANSANALPSCGLSFVGVCILAMASAFMTPLNDPVKLALDGQRLVDALAPGPENSLLMDSFFAAQNLDVRPRNRRRRPQAHSCHRQRTCHDDLPPHEAEPELSSVVRSCLNAFVVSPWFTAAEPLQYDTRWFHMQV
jgi:hypothetical protein